MDRANVSTDTNNGNDVENDTIDDVLIALTQWTRSVMQNLPPLQSGRQAEDDRNRHHGDTMTNDQNTKDEEWEYEQSFPEFQSVLSEANHALRSLLQQLLSLPEGGVEAEDESGGGVEDEAEGRGNAPATPVGLDLIHHHSPDSIITYEQCRDDYEVLIQQIESYLSMVQPPSTSSAVSLPWQQQQQQHLAPMKSSSSSLVLQKPQDIYKMTYHYCNHHLSNHSSTSASQKYPRTLPFIPKIGVAPLPFHHASSTSGSHSVTPIQMKLGNGYDNRFGMLRSTTQMTVPTLENDAVSSSSILYAPTHYCEHLYQTEIQQLEYTNAQLHACSVAEDLPPIHVVDIYQNTDHRNKMNAIPYTYIDTKEQLQQLVQIIDTYHISTIAFDVEAHSYRTFSGIVCLLQMSFYLPTSRATSNIENQHGTIQNYILDTLVLHDDIQMYLLPLMVNPNICKVFHGADMDIQWLQRDFSVYVVNLFDTYRAAKYINEYHSTHQSVTLSKSPLKKFPSLAYAGLVKYYCHNYAINKQHQLSDWRIRPLPTDMIQYAVQDTYYLITIYEYMKYDLFHECGGSTAISSVLDVCKNVSLIRYCLPPFDPYGYRTLLLSLPKISDHSNTGSRRTTQQQRYSTKKQVHNTITAQQELILKELWDWRDRIARQEDESILYVCSNAQLLRIVYSIHFTGNVGGSFISESHFLSIIHSTSSSRQAPPPLLIKYVSDICQLIQTAITKTDTDVIPLATTIADTVDKDKEDTEKEEDDEDLDEEDEDEEDEEVVNSSRVSTGASNLLNPSVQDTAMAMVGQSRTTGSAFFKPAIKTGNDGGNSRTGLRHISANTSISNGENVVPSSSPVLDTDALYEQAGWMTPNDSISQTQTSFSKHIDRQHILATVHTPSIVPVSHNNATGIVNNENAVEVHDTSKPPKLLSIHGTNQEFRSDVQLYANKVDVLGSSRVIGTHKSAPVVTVMSQSISDQKLKYSDVHDAPNNEGVSINAWSEAIPAVLGLISSAESNDNDADDDEDDENEDENDRQIPDINSKYQPPDRRMKTDNEAEFVIPRSIREIYMISNRNRRNKKAGSPTPERGTTPTSEKEQLALEEANALVLSRGDAALRYFVDDATSGKRQKQGTSTKSNVGRESEETLPPYDSSMEVASKEDDFHFMKAIGWIPSSEGISVDAFLNQRPKTANTILSPTEQSSTNIRSDNEPVPVRQVAVDTAVANIGVIHPTSQQLWNNGNSTNPFFAGAAAQAGGPLQQQRNSGGSKSTTMSSTSAAAAIKGGKSSNNSNNTNSDNVRNSGPTGSSSRQVERPDKKESRSYAYRRR
jgi:ribonuclease D